MQPRPAQNIPGAEFTTAEVEAMHELLRHRRELIEFAEYQKARGLIFAKWRGIIIGLAALISAIYLIADKLAPWLGRLIK